MSDHQPTVINESARDTTQRTALINGLRELADWYEAHPDAPQPQFPDWIHTVLAADDTAGAVEVAAVAAHLHTPIVDDGHDIRTERQFGPIRFEASYVYEVASAHYRAHMASYRSYRRDGDAEVIDLGDVLCGALTPPPVVGYPGRPDGSCQYCGGLDLHTFTCTANPGSRS